MVRIFEALVACALLVACVTQTQHGHTIDAPQAGSPTAPPVEPAAPAPIVNCPALVAPGPIHIEFAGPPIGGAGGPKPLAYPPYPAYPAYPPAPACTGGTPPFTEPVKAFCTNLPTDDAKRDAERRCDERIELAVAHERERHSSMHIKFWPVVEYMGPGWLPIGLGVVLLLALLAAVYLSRYALQWAESQNWTDRLREGFMRRLLWLWLAVVFVPTAAIVAAIVWGLWGIAPARADGSTVGVGCPPVSGPVSGPSAVNCDAARGELARATDELNRTRMRLAAAEGELAALRPLVSQRGAGSDIGTMGVVFLLLGASAGVAAVLLLRRDGDRLPAPGVDGGGRGEALVEGAGFVKPGPPSLQDRGPLLRQRVCLWRSEVVASDRELRAALRLPAATTRDREAVTNQQLRRMRLAAVALEQRLQEIVEYIPLSFGPEL